MVSWVIGRALLKIRVVALARPTSGGSVAQMAILRSSTTPTVVYGAASHVTGAKRGRDQSFLVTSWMMAWRATYRRVLRAIDARVTLVNSDRSWRDFAREEFRKTRSPEEAAQLLRLADDYAALLESVHAHKDLLVSYNISTEKSAADAAARAASRVGLQLTRQQE